MEPIEFIRKWEKSELKESASAQSHFIDLCHLLGVETPTDADAIGDTYCFEKGATKSTGGQGFADVWKKHCFGWEYKGPSANLDAAYAQLQRYAVALENPPLLIVSDTKTIVVRTNWTNSVSEVHTLELADLLQADKREFLRNCFLNPDALKPKRTRDDLTKEAADEFSALAQRLRDRGHHAEIVAHFVNRLVFCMFAEDVGLLPNRMFERAVVEARKTPEKAQDFLHTLFGAMKSGGSVGFESVPWFNGGLFDDDRALALDREDVELVHKAAKLFWGDIDPSILGTLFERGLDPSKRSQLGAHYTDRDKIMMIIRPVIIEPLESEWAEAKAKITQLIDNAPKQTSDKLLRGAELAARTKALNEAERLHRDFVDKLVEFRVLDPACGSGNFLYLSLKALKDIEHKANVEAEALGLPRGFPRVGPEAVKGIEINAYAAELARVSIWIGEIQWMRANGFDAATNPILKPLDNIECRDAVLNPDGTRADWPEADVVVGNPPFVGDKKLIREVGEDYATKLRKAYLGSVPGGANLVCYWLERAKHALLVSQTERVGLVTTNAIRTGADRRVLELLAETAAIFEAWSDEPWIVDGASVRVSIICVSRTERSKRLDGESVDRITPSLSEFSQPLPASLRQNSGTSFTGTFLNGPFEIPEQLAYEWLKAPQNVAGHNNSDVLKLTANGQDLLQRGERKWLLDFGPTMTEREAALYEAPFEYARATIKPFRQRRNDEGEFEVRRLSHRNKWWIHAEARPGMRRAVQGLGRFIVTPMVSSTRVFVFLESAYLPNQKLVVFPRDDFTSFGILSSCFHEIWTLEYCSWIGAGNDPTYTTSSVYLTFPFPEGLTPNIAPASYAASQHARDIANAATRLNTLRDNWLNPPDLVMRVPEVTSSYPDRILPISDEAAEVLKKRTLTNLYNERPAWLEHAHRDLDRAVAAAYGWETDFDAGTLPDEEILKRLFALNQRRDGAEPASPS